MVSESQPAPENSALLTSASGLTYEGIKAHFPHVLDVRAQKADVFDPQSTSIAEWFTTESTDLADPSTLPRIIGRVYFLKYGTTIEMVDVKSYLRKARKGKEEKPVPLNQLGKLVSDTVDALAPASVEDENGEQDSYLTIKDLKKRFSRLFPEKASTTIELDTTTPIDTWFASTSKKKVDPSALPHFIGRLFALKHGTSIHPSYIRKYLNGSGKKPVELRRLPSLVSKAVDVLIKGPTERAGRELPSIAKEQPGHHMLSFDPAFRLGENEERPRDSIILSKNSLNYITNAARGYITPLKGTAPETAKGNEKEICARVFTAMRYDYPDSEISDDMLRACIVAAWDLLGVNGAGYEGDKKGSKPLKSKPLNLAGRSSR